MAELDGCGVKSAKVLTILGCGTLGSAILYGLLANNAAREKAHNGQSEGLPDDEHQSGPRRSERVERPTHFIACVRTKKSAARLKQELACRFHQPVAVKIAQGDNVSAVNSASTILLGCQPQDLASCLEEDGLVQALQGKLVISILAGITISQLESWISKPFHTEGSPPTSIIRAMPNTCALDHTSTTLLTFSAEHRHPPDTLDLTNSLLSSIGTVHPIPPGDMDSCTALCGSTPAFFALVLDGLLDGAVALGLKRSEAKNLLAEAMRGVAEGLVKGRDPGEISEKVCTPGGSSIQGLLVMERRGVRGALADALCAAAGANEALGRG